MLGIFTFLLDAGNYEERKVAKDNFDWGMVSTARVSDGKQPYETGIAHDLYDDGSIIIVEAYDDEEAAAEGHKKWVGILTAETLPDFITDCANARFADAVIGKQRYTKQVA